jgi:hypothetical protein
VHGLHELIGGVSLKDLNILKLLLSRPDLSCGRLGLLRERAQGSDKRRAEKSTNRPVESMFSSVVSLS